MKVATSLLAPSAAALQVVKATLDGLKSMKQNSPWITLFNRESQYARNARFQITLAEEVEGGQFLVALMAFGLLAQSALTQILFFKFRKNDVQLKYSAGKVTINTAVLESVRDDMTTRLKAYAKDYVRGLPNL
jgi:hypothetical protein